MCCNIPIFASAAAICFHLYELNVAIYTSPPNLRPIPPYLFICLWIHYVFLARPVALKSVCYQRFSEVIKCSTSPSCILFISPSFLLQFIPRLKCLTCVIRSFHSIPRMSESVYVFSRYHLVPLLPLPLCFACIFLVSYPFMFIPFDVRSHSCSLRSPVFRVAK